MPPTQLAWRERFSRLQCVLRGPALTLAVVPDGIRDAHLAQTETLLSGAEAALRHQLLPSQSSFSRMAAEGHMQQRWADTGHPTVNTHTCRSARWPPPAPPQERPSTAAREEVNGDWHHI